MEIGGKILLWESWEIANCFLGLNIKENLIQLNLKLIGHEL